MNHSFSIRKELRHISQLALPILIAQLSFTAMGLIDTIMAGQYSDLDLAAIAIGTSITIPLMLFGQAILFSVTAKAAPLWGAGRYSDAGSVFQSGVMLALLSSTPLMLILYFLSYQLHIFGVEDDLAKIAKDYQWYLALSLPITGLYQSSRSFIEATGQTRPIMYINLLGLLINIPLNYIFIYGHFGLPAMGSVGCGLATLIVFSCMLLASWLFIKRNQQCQKAFVVMHLADKPALKLSVLINNAVNLAKLGLPIAFTLLAEISLFTAIALLIAPLGTFVIASHQIALSVSSQVFMLPYSQATALTIRVGHVIGENKPTAVMHSIKVGLGLGITISVFTASLVYFGAELLASVYTDNTDLIYVAQGLLLLAAIYQVPDAIQVISNGILRAFHNVKAPLIVSLFAYWLVALPIGYTLSLTNLIVPAMAAKGFWLALIIGLSLNAIALSFILKKQIRRYLAA